MTSSSRGNASLELAIIIPAIMLLIFGTLQFVIFLHARNSAQAASAACAESARRLGSTDVQGRQAAQGVLRAADSLRDPVIELRRTPTEVTCTVSGRVDRLMPIGPVEVGRTAVMPRERIT